MQQMKITENTSLKCVYDSMDRIKVVIGRESENNRKKHFPKILGISERERKIIVNIPEIIRNNRDAYPKSIDGGRRNVKTERHR